MSLFGIGCWWLERCRNSPRPHELWCRRCFWKHSWNFFVSWCCCCFLSSSWFYLASFWCCSLILISAWPQPSQWPPAWQVSGRREDGRGSWWQGQGQDVLKRGVNSGRLSRRLRLVQEEARLVAQPRHCHERGTEAARAARDSEATRAARVLGGADTGAALWAAALSVLINWRSVTLCRQEPWCEDHKPRQCFKPNNFRPAYIRTIVSRASNEGSWRFRNHIEGPYQGALKKLQLCTLGLRNHWRVEKERNWPETATAKRLSIFISFKKLQLKTLSLFV